LQTTLQWLRLVRKCCGRRTFCKSWAWSKKIAIFYSSCWESKFSLLKQAHWCELSLGFLDFVSSKLVQLKNIHTDQNGSNTMIKDIAKW
jgi:hypothetical protein